MKIIIVGVGNQGKKRQHIAANDCVATVDPMNLKADYRQIGDIPLSHYDAALVCVPDKHKIAILTYLLANKKHVLVEKPLWAADDHEIKHLQQLANRNKVICYTAYNHRFEPHFAKMRELIHAEVLGRCYHCRLFYGNGTANLVKHSPWRDQGAGILPDLGSHLLDLIDFWFGNRNIHYEVTLSQCFENKAPDHVVITNRSMTPQLELEMTLLSWRNDFVCDLYAENGSAHIRSLCKWGPNTFILRKRMLPSGRPSEEAITLVQDDPTWTLEYQHFKQLIAAEVTTNLSKDLWIHQQLQQLSKQALGMTTSCLTA